MSIRHEASILRRRIRTLLTDVLRYSSAELLTPSHPLVLRMEKEDPYRISSEYLLLLRKALTVQQTQKLVQDIKVWCRNEYGMPEYSKDERLYIKALAESFLNQLKPPTNG
ncbi:hypothetical protein AVB85_22595 [Salmonella enterica subsp. enterica serovar Vitkin]|nr:hypothetical protein [Salmonella enterica]ECY5311858.1 hypothetical protein [Salmonella enterica subsp. enterica serovar Vitkin]EDE9842297.1 hypothetical protein [Salmonella enterica subsp. enterica serovar Ealing]EDG9410063.1 hypothetical protein [Salmonella enterica subsp. enterica serovar Tennessee]EDL3630191.1 hypothetical protein [Salmonella enterica subsp. enterica serovar Newport]EDS8307647.1 hypothetical protein [Salmonella enterica subsp. enterica serovar Java]EDV6085321.1 hypothe